MKTVFIMLAILMSISVADASCIGDFNKEFSRTKQLNSRIEATTDCQITLYDADELVRMSGSHMDILRSWMADMKSGIGCSDHPERAAEIRAEMEVILDQIEKHCVQ